jgi:hypothetical protein
MATIGEEELSGDEGGDGRLGSAAERRSPADGGGGRMLAPADDDDDDSGRALDSGCVCEGASCGGPVAGE